LLRVLNYPKFKLSAADREDLLSDYLPYCQTVRIPARLPRLPQCRDIHGQAFLELAAVGKAALLVTGDRGLLVLAAEFSRKIVTADQMLGILGAG
jgi:predicted nucleic acid-binding protein